MKTELDGLFLLLFSVRTQQHSGVEQIMSRSHFLFLRWCLLDQHTVADLILFEVEFEHALLFLMNDERVCEPVGCPLNELWAEGQGEGETGTGVNQETCGLRSCLVSVFPSDQLLGCFCPTFTFSLPPPRVQLHT